MKLVISLVAFLFLGNTLLAIEEENVKSKITNVTVYSQGAQIFRTASYSVKTGVTKIHIDFVSRNMDANSLQVKATGNVILLDSKFSMYYPKPEEIKLDGLPLQIRKDIKNLEDSIENISYLIQSLQDELDIVNATKNILSNNGAMRSQGKVNDSLPLLKQAIDYYMVKMTELTKKAQDISRKKSDKTKEKNAMNVRLNELKNYQNSNKLEPIHKGPIPRITVTVKASAAATGKLDISYLVSEAGWSPLYDLRSEIADGKVNLNYKAQVYQNTGVDWEDVKLNISTNNPYMNKTKPELHPWWVDYNNYYQRQDQYQSQAPAAPKKLETMSIQADEESINQGWSNVSAAQNASQFVTVINQGISAEFAIDLPYTIVSNNEQHIVLIKNVDLKANYQYFSVPKIDCGAYLVAQVSKLDELQLVPARANIFFDGSYIGETYIDPSSMDDTLNLSLGKDPNIIVKRTLSKRDFKDKVIGNSREREFTYDIEVKNLKSNDIDITIQDQYPVTNNAAIEIELFESSRAKVDKTTGIIEWKMTLKPKDKKTMRFGYKVKHDKNQNVYL